MYWVCFWVYLYDFEKFPCTCHDELRRERQLARDMLGMRNCEVVTDPDRIMDVIFCELLRNFPESVNHHVHWGSTSAMRNPPLIFVTCQILLLFSVRKTEESEQKSEQQLECLQHGL